MDPMYQSMNKRRPCEHDPCESQQSSSSAKEQLPVPQAVPAQSARHFSAAQQQSALISPPQPDRQPPGPALQPRGVQPAETLALNTALTIVDVIAHRLGVDPQQLDQAQRVSLIAPAVQALGVYLDLLNHKESHR